MSYLHLPPVVLPLTYGLQVIYINVKQPIDPNRIIQHYLKSVEETGVTQTRFAQPATQNQPSPQLILTLAYVRFTLKVFPCQAVCGAELSKVVSATKELVAQTAEEVKKEKGADYDVTVSGSITVSECPQKLTL